MLFILICSLVICASQVESNSRRTENVLLNDGNRMPAISYGTFMADLNDRKYMTQAVVWAIEEAGYRNINTAAVYASEDLIGEAIKIVIKRGIVKREDLFIATTLPITCGTDNQVIPALRDSLERLQLDYVDLYFIHTPRNVLNLKRHDYLDLWKGLEKAKRRGLTKSIGVANFNSTEINRILLNSKIPPAVNRIETNPTYTNLELVAYCQSNNIVVNGYAPFGYLVDRPFNDLSPTFKDPILVGMAEEYCVEVSQIILRYLWDRCIVSIAASLDKEQIKSNADIFHFTLSPENILTINNFDQNVKVYKIDDAGLDEYMRTQFRYLTRFVKDNNLKQYKNVVDD